LNNFRKPLTRLIRRAGTQKPLRNTKNMKKYFRMKRSLLTLMLIAVISSLSFAQTSKTKVDKKPAKVEFKWYTFDEAYALNKKVPKMVFIDVFTD
jgi:hypothetical protein